MDLVRQVAPRTTPVLLLGETGVGKEVVPSAIHAASPRRDGPMVRVNCGAIPEGLIDSERFGHERGAFTGAVSMQRGRFERAAGGTLFLDEVAELPLSAQVRLLRVLQTRELERVGGSRTLPADVRVIAATPRDLESLITAGAFRQDLWFRLNVLPIRIPPLRERRGAIPTLTVHLLERKAREPNLPGSPRLAPGTLDRLVGYDRPGNVREPQNVLELALILSGGRPLVFDELGATSPRIAPRAAPVLPREELAPLDHVVAEHLSHALQVCRGRVEGPAGAAARLGLHPSTLRHRLRRLGIPFGRIPA
jgi:transcriptional regulator with GAF, ATPase, and Fis domain